MTIQLGEILSGDCEDDKVRENHFKTLVALAKMVEQAAENAAAISKSIVDHNQLVCKKLEELRLDLRAQSMDLSKQVTSLALFDKDLQSIKRDVDNIGSKLRGHEVWHESQRALHDQATKNEFEAWKRPVINWFVVGALGLVLMGIQTWMERGSQGKMAALVDAVSKNTGAIQSIIEKGIRP